MRIDLALTILVLSASVSAGLECRLALSEEHCTRLHRRYEELHKVYKRAENRKHVNPAAYTALHRELVRVASLIGHEIPGSNEEESRKYLDMYSGVALQGQDKTKYEKAYAKFPGYKNQGYADADVVEQYQQKYSERGGDSMRKYSDGLHEFMEEETSGSYKKKSGNQQGNYGNKKCNDAVSKERCDELLRQYAILKELYSNKTTKAMLSLDAYSDLRRDLTEAGINIEEKHEEDKYSKKNCDESVSKEECDALMKKYKIMKDMYNDADLKAMLDPEAYNDLNREMAEAGIVVGKKIPHGHEHEHMNMSCDESIPKETCDSLLKKYKVMKEMYNDVDLKDMLNPNAYNGLKRDMEDAGIHHVEKSKNGKHHELQCDERISKETCDSLIKKYKVMTEMYDDADLKEMLNPDAYNDLMREMTDAGIDVENKGIKHASMEMTCDKSVSKEECGALLEKYKVMTEMYNDDDLKNMLNPEAYNDLEREMQEAGINIKGSKKKGKYQHAEMKCDESVPKETCESLLRQYKTMKELYNDPDMKKMLDPNAYNELHREMVEAGMNVPEKTGKRELQKHGQHRIIRRCVKDGLYRYDQFSFIFCSNGLGFVQKCPEGTMHGNDQGNHSSYSTQNFCNVKHEKPDDEITEAKEDYI